MGNVRQGVQRENQGLYWALGISILLHLILMLVSLWVPLSTSSASLVEVDAPPEPIEFRFSDSPAEPTTDDPLEDAPFLPVEPQEEPASVPDGTGPEVPPLPPPETAQSVPEEVEAPGPVEETDAPPEELESEPAPSDLPTLDDPAAFEQPPPEAAGSGPTAPTPAQPSMRKALRDFGQALADRPPPPPPSRPGTDVPRNVVMPDTSEIPTTGFGMGNLVFESQDYDWNDYGRQIYWAIWKAWHHRLWMTTDDFEKWAHHGGNWYLEHSTQVRFVIEGNGQVTGIVQEAPSGCGPLDASALDALSEVILPPLPGDFPRDREVVHARFLAKGHIRALRPTLSRLKRAGLF